MAILIPLLGSIFPIKDLLGHRIVESLDKEHSKTSSIQVKLKNEQNPGFNYGNFTAALFTVIYGASIYFFLPYS